MARLYIFLPFVKIRPHCPLDIVDLGGVHLHADTGEERLAEVVAEREPLVISLVMAGEVFGRLPQVVGEGEVPDEVAVAQFTRDIRRDAEIIGWSELVFCVVVFIHHLVLARIEHVDAAAVAEAGMGRTRIADLEGVAQAVMPQLRVRLTHADAVQDIDEVVFLEGVVFVADLADASLGKITHSRLCAQNVDAFVGHFEGTVGGV